MKVTRQCYTDYTKDELNALRRIKDVMYVLIAEKKKPFHVTKKLKEKGVLKAGTLYECGLFEIKHRDCYKCYTCGCEWESDLY